MERQSFHQYGISVQELWDGLNPSGFQNGIFVILRGYIDESYNRDLFTLSSLIGDGGTWFYLEQDWTKCLQVKNESLTAQGRQAISRYHAADCSSLKGEFRGWTVEEQIDFTKQLLSALKKYPLHTLAYTISLTELVREVPETEPNPLRFAYILLLPLIMVEIGNFTLRTNPSAVSLIHDRSSYDAALLEMFNHTINDPAFQYRDSFTNLVAMSWKHCVPLQPTDLMAYENFKESERLTRTPRKRRKSLDYLLTIGQIGGRLRGFEKEAFCYLREQLDKMSEPAKQFLIATTAKKEPSESEKFDSAMRKILSVSHTELQARHEEWKKQKQRKHKKRTKA